MEATFEGCTFTQTETVDAAELAALRKDAERLAFLYSGKKTGSNALIEAEIRMLNDRPLTLDEVREAIDDAMRTPLVPAVGAA